MHTLLVERKERGLTGVSPVSKRGDLKRAITALAFTLFAAASLAECVKTTPVKQEYKQSEAVVIGTVESARRMPQTWDTFDGTDFVVHVDQKIKGKQSGEIVVFSEHSDRAFPMKVGSQYLLFLTDNYQHWEVNECGNSGAMEDEGTVIKKIVHMLGED